jgi:hypothetical protein
MVSAGAYANTSTIGCAFMLGGLAIIEKEHPSLVRLALGASLLALGGWCRLDALAMAPLAWPLLARRTPTQRSLLSLTLLAFFTATVLGMLLWISATTPTQIWATFTDKQPTGTLLATLSQLYLLVGSFGLILSIIGTVRAWYSTQRWLAAAMLSVFLPLFLIHGRSFDSPKYFYYACPVLIWAIAYYLSCTHLLCHSFPKYTRVTPQIWGIAGVACLLLEGSLSIRTSVNPDSTWQTSQGIPLLEFKREPGKAATITCGTGNPIPTGDSFRFRWGHIWGPLEWHRAKERIIAFNETLSATIEANPTTPLVSTTYYSWQRLNGLMRQRNYRPATDEPITNRNPSSRHIVWENGLMHREEFRINHTEFRFEELRQAVMSSPSKPLLLFSDMPKLYNEEFLAQTGATSKCITFENRANLGLYQFSMGY